MPYIRVFVRSLLIASLSIAPLLAFAEPPQEIKPPVAAKKPHETTMQGETRVDSYFWLPTRPIRKCSPISKRRTRTRRR
jgi:hypothetical protein